MMHIWFSDCFGPGWFWFRRSAHFGLPIGTSCLARVMEPNQLTWIRFDAPLESWSGVDAVALCDLDSDVEVSVLRARQRRPLRGR